MSGRSLGRAAVRNPGAPIQYAHDSRMHERSLGCSAVGDARMVRGKVLLHDTSLRVSTAYARVFRLLHCLYMCRTDTRRVFITNPTVSRRDPRQAKARTICRWIGGEYPERMRGSTWYVYHCCQERARTSRVLFLESTGGLQRGQQHKHHCLLR